MKDNYESADITAPEDKSFLRSFWTRTLSSLPTRLFALTFEQCRFSEVTSMTIQKLISEFRSRLTEFRFIAHLFIDPGLQEVFLPLAVNHSL